MPRNVRIRIALSTLLTVPLVAAGCWALVQLWPVAVVLIAALMLAGVLSPLVHGLERRGLRRSWALALVFVSCAGVLGLVGFVTLPALWAQVGQLLDNLPQLQARLAGALGERRALRPLADAIRRFQPVPASTPAGTAATFAAASLSLVEVLGYGATSVVMALYFLSDRERLRGALYALVPRRFHVRLARVLLNLEHIVGHYIRGQVITSVAFAGFTFALLRLCHIDNALPLAAFAGLTDVIPFVGGLLVTVPAALAALPHGTALAGVVMVSMLAYQEFESRVLVPRIYGSALRLPSVAVVVALLVGGKLGGIIGAFFALPVAAGLLMLVEELRLTLPGDDTHDEALRARDERAEEAYALSTAGASSEDAAKVAVRIASDIEQADASASKSAETVPVTGGEKGP